MNLLNLLQREQFKINTDKISDYLNNKTVLVTGAAGSIGSVLAKKIATFNVKKLVLLDCNELGVFNLKKDLFESNPNLNVEFKILSIIDKNAIKQCFLDTCPDIVYHAAANKHVGLSEDNVYQAFNTNVIGTKNLIEASIASNVDQFMLVSTDKAVDPTTVMGATKLTAEYLIKLQSQEENYTKFNIVRFGNVLGSSGSVVPIFKKQIENNKPVIVNHPLMCRYFMLIEEAVDLLLEASSYDNDAHLFVLNMGKPVFIVELAKSMMKEIGKSVPITFGSKGHSEKLEEKLVSERHEESLLQKENQNISYYSFAEYFVNYSKYQNIILNLIEDCSPSIPNAIFKKRLMRCYA